MRCYRTDELPLEERQKWAASRVWAAHQAPYLSTALLTLDPVVVDTTGIGDDADILDRNLRDAPTDVSRFPTDTTWHVYIDPATLRALEVPEIGFWLIHQVTHLLREHAGRYPGALSPGDDGRNADQRRWNLAADSEIADAAVVAGRPPPDDSVTPERLNMEPAKTAEQYWNALGDRAGPVPQGLAAIDCGTGCDGRPRPWNCGWPGLSKSGAQLTALHTARQIRDHIKSRDDVPAGWRRWATDLLEPSVNWRRVLAAQVRRGVGEVAGRVDFTYRRPSRRAAALPGVIMPGMHRPLPVVAVLIDTSGSMSDGMLGQALGEVSGVLHGLGVGRGGLKVIACDAEAYAPQAVHQVAGLVLAGGGGTDMRAGLAAAVNLRPRPDLIVALTDGHGPWPNTPPRGIRVVVGLMDPTGESPGWAERVLIGDHHDEGAA